MREVTIYHNPRCTKSRQTLALLRDQGIEPNVVEYLKTPPNEQTLGKLVKLLGIFYWAPGGELFLIVGVPSRNYWVQGPGDLIICSNLGPYA